MKGTYFRDLRKKIAKISTRENFPALQRLSYVFFVMS